jgi:hypothetical protein
VQKNRERANNKEDAKKRSMMSIVRKKNFKKLKIKLILLL